MSSHGKDDNKQTGLIGQPSFASAKSLKSVEVALSTSDTLNDDDANNDGSGGGDDDGDGDGDDADDDGRVLRF